MAKRKSRWRPDGRPEHGPASGVWLYGTHAVLAAMANPERRIQRLVATSESVKTLGSKILPEAYPEIARPRLEVLTRAEIERLLPEGAVAQGVAAMAAHLPGRNLHQLLTKTQDATSAVLVVLDQPNDPQNVGAVIRSAAAFGAQALVFPKDHAPEPTGSLAKAASGALERVPLVSVTNLVRALNAIKEAGYWVVGLDAEGSMPLYSVDMGGKVALVLGSEGAGLRRLTRESCDHLARIPIVEAAESLNLSAAAAIALHEWSRRSATSAEPRARLAPTETGV